MDPRLQQEMYEQYKRQNTVDRWTAYIMFGWLALPVLILAFIWFAG